MIGWSVGRSVGRLDYRWIDRSIIYRAIDWSIDWFTGWLTDWLIGWLIYRWISWTTTRSWSLTRRQTRITLLRTSTVVVMRRPINWLHCVISVWRQTWWRDCSTLHPCFSALSTLTESQSEQSEPISRGAYRHTRGSKKAAVETKIQFMERISTMAVPQQDCLSETALG